MWLFGGLSESGVNVGHVIRDNRSQGDHDNRLGLVIVWSTKDKLVGFCAQYSVPTGPGLVVPVLDQRF